VGVASTKFVAKLASDLSKPDGLLVVAPGTELAFLHPLPVERLWGVGPATSGVLHRLGLRTVGDLAGFGEDALVAALGDAHGRHLHALAHNDDPRAVEPERVLKSVGHEETFPVDHTDREVLAREVVRLADRTATRLRANGLRGRTVQLKVRFADFRTITRSRTLSTATDLAADVSTTARALLDAVDVTEGVRLLGVSVQQLAGAGMGDGEQQALPLGVDDATTPSDGRRAALERSIDGVRRRYGDESVIPARLAAGRLATGRPAVGPEDP
jgi:DNA polymerase-4